MLAVVVNNSLTLFQSEFLGVRMLVPHFITALNQVLTSVKPLEGISFKGNFLRESSIHILKSLVCLPAHFSDIFSNIRPQLAQLILEGLKTEEDTKNRQMLLWTATAFLYDNIEHPDLRDFSHNFCTFLLTKVVSGTWAISDILQGLDVLAEVSNLYQYVNHYNKDTAGYIVSTLARYLEIWMTQPIKKEETIPESQIIKSFYCALDWIMADNRNQWILSNPLCLKLVLEAIEIGITGQKYVPGNQQQPVPEKDPKNKRTTVDTTKGKQQLKTFNSPTDKIREAANFVLLNMVNHVDNYPTPVGPSSGSALSSERDLVEKFNLKGHFVTTFVYHNTVYSVIRHPRAKGNSKVSTVIRDDTGRYVWSAELNLNGTQFVDPGDDDAVAPAVAKEQPAVEVDEELLQTLSGFLSDAEKRMQDKVLRLSEVASNKESNLLKGRNFGRNVNIALQHPHPPLWDDNADKTVTRLFMSNLGLLNTHNFDDLFFVERFTDMDRQFNYAQNFNLLDKTKERGTFSLGVIYVMKGQDETAVLENESGSKSYQKFLRKLGWGVNLNEHVGHSGNLDPKVSGNLALYYANYSCEVIFQVATMMPNRESSSKQLHKQRLINGNRVLISWVEDLDEYTPPSGSTYVFNIVIHPLPSGLFMIRIFDRGMGHDPQKECPFGPALDTMILSQHVLASVVRQTALNVSRLTEERGKSNTMRQFLIEDFIARHHVEQPMNQFFAYNFAD
eukprot:TRINITY_DN3888_c0_g1_i5.p1 TRINITY_DN3888_c0_g1~~TRINITY_DN3888_c0_g1_i5.p1  ORF type:complete len:730 (-),score=262.15 TRINITY_DN3888_c0_g1_i5:86-2275(-)